MTTRVLDRFPAEEIHERARSIRFWPTVGLWIAACLYGIGWTVAKVGRVLWYGLTWCWAALAIGYRDGRNRRRGDE